VPIDIFIMADGEPEDRHVTKICGLPYRPADEPWPVNAEGEPMLFVAQINFSESLDLVGKLPGEMLLVFTDFTHFVKHGAIDELIFEWRSRTTKPLISAARMPRQDGGFKPCFGYRCRTVSYPHAERIRDDDITCRGKDVHADYRLMQYQGTQIGTAPYFVQPGLENDVRGRLICAISTVHPSEGKPHPWVNRAQPLNRVRLREYFSIADLGCLYISIDDAGKLRWTGASA
jgi:hypothetical protein